MDCKIIEPDNKIRLDSLRIASLFTFHDTGSSVYMIVGINKTGSVFDPPSINYVNLASGALNHADGDILVIQLEQIGQLQLKRKV